MSLYFWDKHKPESFVSSVVSFISWFIWKYSLYFRLILDSQKSYWSSSQSSHTSFTCMIQITWWTNINALLPKLILYSNFLSVYLFFFSCFRISSRIPYNISSSCLPVSSPLQHFFWLLALDDLECLKECYSGIWRMTFRFV